MQPRVGPPHDERHPVPVVQLAGPTLVESSGSRGAATTTGLDSATQRHRRIPVRSNLPISLLLLAVITVCTAAAAAATVTARGGGLVVVERLGGSEAPPNADAPLEWLHAPERQWTAAAQPGLIRAPDATWWRIRLPPDVHDRSDRAVLVLRDVFDARLVAWIDGQPQPVRLDRFDEGLIQPGSREHLLIPLTPGLHPEVVHLRVDFARRVPIGVALEPLDDFLERDLDRVRFHTISHVALLLFGFVAAIYALALRRHHMLLLSGWCLGATIYLVVMSGELYAIPGAEPLLPNINRRNRQINRRVELQLATAPGGGW